MSFLCPSVSPSAPSPSPPSRMPDSSRVSTLTNRQHTIYSPPSKHWSTIVLRTSSPCMSPVPPLHAPRHSTHSTVHCLPSFYLARSLPLLWITIKCLVKRRARTGAFSNSLCAAFEWVFLHSPYSPLLLSFSSLSSFTDFPSSPPPTSRRSTQPTLSPASFPPLYHFTLLELPTITATAYHAIRSLPA